MDSVKIWYAAAFVTFCAVIAKPLLVKGATSLDQYSAGVAKKLADAKKLHEEAAALLEKYQHEQKNAASESKRLVEQAEHEAMQLKNAAFLTLEQQLAAQQQRASEKIARAEQQAVQEIRAIAVNLGLDAATTILAAQQKSVADAVTAVAEKIAA